MGPHCIQSNPESPVVAIRNRLPAMNAQNTTRPGTPRSPSDACAESPPMRPGTPRPCSSTTDNRDDNEQKVHDVFAVAADLLPSNRILQSGMRRPLEMAVPTPK